MSLKTIISSQRKRAREKERTTKIQRIINKMAGISLYLPIIKCKWIKLSSEKVKRHRMGEIF